MSWSVSLPFGLRGFDGDVAVEADSDRVGILQLVSLDPDFRQSHKVAAGLLMQLPRDLVLSHVA